MKANSQASVPIKQKPMPVQEEDVKDPEENDEFEEEIEEEEEKPVVVQKKKLVPKQQIDPTQISDQIRDLQDNGIYRLQKLGVLHQINQNLKVIAGILVDLTK